MFYIKFIHIYSFCFITATFTNAKILRGFARLSDVELTLVGR